jgi:hypothetical protein
MQAPCIAKLTRASVVSPETELLQRYAAVWAICRTFTLRSSRESLDEGLEPAV